MKSIQIIIAIAALFALTVDANPTCELCQKVAAEIKQRVTGDLIAKAEKMLMDRCDDLRNEDEKKICKDKVERAMEQVKTLLKMSPKELCQMLGVCSRDVAYLRQLMGSRKNLKDIERMRDNILANYQTQIMSLLSTRKQSPMLCDACIMVVKQFQQLVQRPEFRNAIDKSIESVCRMVAGGKIKDCIDESKAYAAESIKFIVEQDPKTLCSFLGECVVEQEDKLLQRVTESVVCDNCKKIVDQIKPKLKDPDFRAKAEKAVRGICDLVSDESLRKQCNDYMSQMIDEVIILVDMSTSEDICQAMRAC